MQVSDILYKVRKVFLLSLIFALILGYIEMLAEIYGLGIANIAIKIFNYFPFLEKKFIDNRVSAFADEPPFFAVYLITVAGWMFSYILTEKTMLKYLPAIVVIFLTYYSGSRTAFIVVFIQIIIFLSFIINKDQLLLATKFAFISIFFFSVLLFTFSSSKFVNDIEKKMESLDFIGNLKKSKSNQSRFGMQVAALEVFKINPLFGVGFGQQTYHSRFHYPGWATRDNYEYKLWYKESSIKAFPPSYNMYTRLLAETGIIGFLIFLFFIRTIIRSAKLLCASMDRENKNLGIILLVSLSGLFVNLLQIDTFRLYGIWFSITILIIVGNKTKQIYNE